jgi:phosphotransacetylase
MADMYLCSCSLQTWMIMTKMAMRMASQRLLSHMRKRRKRRNLSQSAVSAVTADREEDAEKAVAMGSLSMDAVVDEDALVSAMQSASISGSRISDMPTP